MDDWGDRYKCEFFGVAESLEELKGGILQNP